MISLVSLVLGLIFYCHYAELCGLVFFCGSYRSRRSVYSLFVTMPAFAPPLFKQVCAVLYLYFPPGFTIWLWGTNAHSPPISPALILPASIGTCLNPQGRTPRSAPRPNPYILSQVFSCCYPVLSVWAGLCCLFSLTLCQRLLLNPH